MHKNVVPFKLMDGLISYLLRLTRELLGTDAGDLELTSKGKKRLVFLMAAEDTIRQIADATKERDRDFLKKKRKIN